MNRARPLALALMLALLGLPGSSLAADCPPEVAEAKAAVAKAEAAAKKAGQVTRNREVQAPRSQAGSRSQDVQAPRGQEIQAPKGQDVQAPRGQEIQAPKGQDVQAPRGQEIQAPRTPSAGAIAKARALVGEAEQHCNKAEMSSAAAKARAALALLK